MRHSPFGHAALPGAWLGAIESEISTAYAPDGLGKT